MFTGIIEGTGTVRSVMETEEGAGIRFEVPFPGSELRLGASIAVDGTCLTVEEATEDGFIARVVPATLERTIAGRYRPGHRVNLERAAQVGARLDGHLVQGHVDGVGELVGRDEGEAGLRLRFRLPDEVWDRTVSQGSVCINGVSLTVQALPAPGEVDVALIPYTARHTNLGALAVGAAVNVEGDLIAKYVGKMLAPYQTPSGRSPGAEPQSALADRPQGEA